MLVSRADACPSDGEQRRETSCDVAMLWESYCLKDGSQQPENNQAKDHKKNGIEHRLVAFQKVAPLAEPPRREITDFRGNYSAEQDWRNLLIVTVWGFLDLSTPGKFALPYMFVLKPTHFPGTALNIPTIEMMVIDSNPLERTS